jgi:hypothetical protein
MKRRHFIALALALVAAGFPAATAATTSPSMLPLNEGNRWVLRDPDLGGTRSISVLRRPSGLVLRGVPGASDLRVRTVGRAIEVWDASSRRWEPFLRLGAAAGTTYLVDLPGTAFWRSLVVRVASRRVEVEDARGKTLRNCVRLTFSTKKPIADAGLEELVFAPGVGFALSSEQTIAGPRVYLLAALRLSS